MAALYDQIGQSYRATRTADPRILQGLMDLLSVPRGSVLCDVGAGSGNYANALAAQGYSVLAVDPSEVMRAQAVRSERVTWFPGIAENMPLPDDCAAGVICVFAAHHFTKLSEAVREMNRICPNGPLVFFTFDPRAAEIWFSDYFPEITQAGRKIFPPDAEFVKQVEAVTGRRGDVHNFPLPGDLIDQFMHVPWNRPEAYLDATFRANNSGFAKADPDSVSRGLARLSADLASGAWDARNSALRTAKSYDAGYRFVVFRRN
jgi:ubiquinone/menaquinone biosynthesis C-methylase UbiE